ncbi:zinc-dependent alcohol dehydrogenase family protein [Silvibacterium dinghuense]|uniref:NAD(P)-dependent alcohol dehydrogenase n=1 Tax=Silvibacterium dinghuense TaxID=1560006 RepID=A0A4Q1SBG3_9BACT|nr:NAD(P)-dependent alcohol dehydrogenase [Silvibacterium dinghuense]RXS94471.1 NAD(P)-dependent alcohol dehydrogenase [Silvibacterium dinghuense]GGH15896.1 alcohol dehydrogenase [Silvibacterium dinghuense]
MKAWQLHGLGLENLKPGEAPIPTPQANEVLIQVKAVSLNFRDKAIVDGIYEPELVPKLLIPVSDVVGTVVAVGQEVTHLKEGDRVNSNLYSSWVDGDAEPDYGLFSYGTPLPGALAEYMILNASTSVKAPAFMSDEEAATLPIAALTAWYAMTDLGQLKPGQTVLVQGTGGVSIFALQLATALGAKVIATSSRDENLARVKELGAWQVINYRQHPAWEKKTLEFTNGRGVDQLLDVVGGEGLNQSVQATRIGGQIHQIGFLDSQVSKLDLMPVLFRQTVLRGICVGPAQSFERMNEFLNQHRIHPVIDTVYSFDQAREAYEHLARGAFGKIVIKVSA